MTSPSPTAPYLSLCHPISSYADGPGPVTEKRSSAAAAPPWPGALSRAWSGSVLSPQPGLVRFGPLSPVLWILSPQPGPVRCPQPTSVPSARFSPPLGRAQSPQSGSVSLAQFCPLGPVLSPRLGPLGPVLSPQPRSVSTIRSLQPSPAPSVRPVSLSLSLSPFRPVPVPSARFCPFGPVLSARFLQLSTSGRAAAGPPSRAAHSWDTAGSRRQLQAGTPQPDTASRDPREQQPPPPKKGELPAPPNHGCGPREMGSGVGGVGGRGRGGGGSGGVC